MEALDDGGEQEEDDGEDAEGKSRCISCNGHVSAQIDL